MKYIDDLMHAPCAICKSTIGDNPISFVFSGSLLSVCSDKCADEWDARLDEILDCEPQTKKGKACLVCKKRNGCTYSRYTNGCLRFEQEETLHPRRCA